MATIYLYNLHANRIEQLVINLNATLKALKNLLRSSSKGYWAECEWYLNNIKLEDNVSLTTIAPHSTIICEEKNTFVDGIITMTLLTMTGAKVPIKVHPLYTIERVKDMICTSQGCPPDQQRLIYEGRQLEDGRILSEYNVVDGSYLHLVLRLRGQGHEVWIGKCVLHGIGHNAYLELLHPIPQPHPVPLVYDDFLRVIDSHGIQIKGRIEGFDEGQRRGVRWTPAELLRIGEYKVALDLLASHPNTRPEIWQRHILSPNWGNIEQTITVACPSIILHVKRIGSNALPRLMVLSFSEPSDQIDLVAVLKRNIAATWGIAVLFITSGDNGDVSIEDDGDVMQLRGGDQIHFWCGAI